MFLSLGSTSRSANSATALFGGHGQGQGSSDREQFDTGRGLERLPCQQLQQKETQIDPLQALAGGKYSSLQRQHHHQNSPRPFHQVQTTSPFDIHVPSIDGTQLIPYPSSSAILSSTFGQGQLPSTSFSTSTSSGGGPSCLQPSPSLPSSSLQPSLSRDSHGSVFGNGGEEVLSARFNEQGTGAAAGGKRRSVALLLAKQVKEKLGINKLREVVQHDVASGASNKNNSNNNNNNNVLLQQQPSSPGSRPGFSRSPWEWVQADRDRNIGFTKDDVNAMAPSPSPSPSSNRQPNNVHASRICRTNSLSSIGDRNFDVKETVLGVSNLEALADTAGISLSGSIDGSLGGELERSRPGFAAHRSCPLPATSALADSLGLINSTRGAEQFGGGTWGGGPAGSTGSEVCLPSRLLSTQFTSPSAGVMTLPETDTPAAMTQFLKDQTTASKGWRAPSTARAPVVRRQFPEAAAMGVCRQEPAVVRQSAPQTTRFGGSFGDIDNLFGGGDADFVNCSNILSELYGSVDAINNDFFSDLQGEVAAMDNMSEAVARYGAGTRQQKPWEKYALDQSARMWLGGMGGMVDDSDTTTALSEMRSLQALQGLKRTRSVRDGDDSCDVKVAQTKRSCAQAINNMPSVVNSASLAENLEELLGSLPSVVGTPSFRGASGNTFGEILERL